MRVSRTSCSLLVYLSSCTQQNLMKIFPFSADVTGTAAAVITVIIFIQPQKHKHGNITTYPISVTSMKRFWFSLFWLKCSFIYDWNNSVAWNATPDSLFSVVFAVVLLIHAWRNDVTFNLIKHQQDRKSPGEITAVVNRNTLFLQARATTPKTPERAKSQGGI